MPKQKELLEYQIINLNLINAKNISAQLKTIVKTIKNEPIILEGDLTAKLLGQLFFVVAKFAEEVVWRENPKKTAGLVLSRLDDSEIIRPIKVEIFDEWAETQEKVFFALRKKDTTSEIMIDLDFFWQEATAHRGNEVMNFAQFIYSINPLKSKVVFSGEIPPLPALIAFNWFRPYCKNIFFEKTKIN